MSSEVTHIFAVGAVILSVSVVASAVIGYLYNLDRKKEFLLMLLVPTVAALMYVVMANGVGVVEGFDGPVNVDRYVDWIITTPILLYILVYVMTSTSAEKWKVFKFIAAADIVIFVAGFGAEFYAGSLKLMFFSVAMIAYIAMLYRIIDLLIKLDRERLLDGQITSALGMAWVILILWSLYPSVWVFGTKGVAIIGMKTEVIIYLVLDILSKVGFTALLGRYLYLEKSSGTDLKKNKHA